ncbi:MAG: hypothetical protein JWP97_5390 [Labilithrix sp.]|nr:hypothetical protein [Labilithrix sp.]
MISAAFHMEIGDLREPRPETKPARDPWCSIPGASTSKLASGERWGRELRLPPPDPLLEDMGEQGARGDRSRVAKDAERACGAAGSNS